MVGDVADRRRGNHHRRQAYRPRRRARAGAARSRPRAVVSRVEAGADETVADVVAAGRRATTVLADVANPANCRAIVEHAVKTFGRVDVLVNLASISPLHAARGGHADYWETNLDVNLRSAFLSAHAAMPAHARGSSGRIVNFADWLARAAGPLRRLDDQLLAEAGGVALTEALALEDAQPHPGQRDRSWPRRSRRPNDARRDRRRWRGRRPRHWGGEGEIATAVLLLCETDFVTGETIRVDGGRRVEDWSQVSASREGCYGARPQPTLERDSCARHRQQQRHRPRHRAAARAEALDIVINYNSDGWRRGRRGGRWRWRTRCRSRRQRRIGRRRADAGHQSANALGGLDVLVQQRRHRATRPFWDVTEPTTTRPEREPEGRVLQHAGVRAALPRRRPAGRSST